MQLLSNQNIQYLEIYKSFSFHLSKIIFCDNKCVNRPEVKLN